MDFSCFNYQISDRRKFIQNKKLYMLNMFRDSLERKIAAVSASIEVLQNQISRDEESALEKNT